MQLADWDGPLVLTGRSEERLSQTRKQVIARGGRAVTFVCDCTNQAQVAELVAYAEDQAPLYGVVISVGTAQFGLVVEQPGAVWRQQLDVNLAGPYQLTHAVLKPLLGRGAGHLVFINSVAGFKSFPGSSAYVAAKHGLRGLAETLRQEVREAGVKVTTIYPGATSTEWWDKQEGEFPRRRMLKPEDVAAATAFALKFSRTGVIEELTLRHVGGDF